MKILFALVFVAMCLSRLTYASSCSVLLLPPEQVQDKVQDVLGDVAGPMTGHPQLGAIAQLTRGLVMQLTLRKLPLQVVEGQNEAFRFETHYKLATPHPHATVKGLRISADAASRIMDEGLAAFQSGDLLEQWIDAVLNYDFAQRLDAGKVLAGDNNRWDLSMRAAELKAAARGENGEIAEIEIARKLWPEVKEVVARKDYESLLVHYGLVELDSILADPPKFQAEMHGVQPDLEALAKTRQRELALGEYGVVFKDLGRQATRLVVAMQLGEPALGRAKAQFASVYEAMEKYFDFSSAAPDSGDAN